MNKLIPLSLAAATTAALLAQPVLSQNIVVTPSISHTQFVEKVSEDLDKQLGRASRYPSLPFGEGITIVRFTRDGSGDADNVQVYRRSGINNLDRIATRAVRNLRSLDSVPAGVGPQQVYQANIIFASDEEELAELRATLNREEASRMARGGAERSVLAFGSASTRPSS